MSEPVRMQWDREADDIMRAIAKAIDCVLNDDAREKIGKPAYGFVLLVAEFGKIDGGRVNYISNGRREDMLAMVREYLARMEGRAHDAPEQPQ